jgi:two-component system cell cycle response regulator DivK
MVGKILYIEDNPLNMRLVHKMLKAAGYEMIEAQDALTGIQTAIAEKPDLILMDLNLPDIDGLEATARLKANPELAYIPVVALTANAMHGDRERCLESGCEGYIPKPVTRIELLNVVNYFMRQGVSVPAASGM